MNDRVDRKPGRVVSAQSHGDTARLHATGEFDLANHQQLAEALRTAVSGGHRKVEVDIGRVTLIDAGAIRILLRYRDLAAEHGCALRIVNPTGMSATILLATGTTELLCAIDGTSAGTHAGRRSAVCGYTDTQRHGVAAAAAMPSPPSPRRARPTSGNTAWARLGSWDELTASGRAINSARFPEVLPGDD